MTAIANDTVSSFSMPSTDSSFSSEDQNIKQLEQQVDQMINQALQQSSSSLGQNQTGQDAGRHARELYESERHLVARSEQAVSARE